MRKWMRKILWPILLVALVLGIYGCVTYVDPATGQKLWAMDPNVAGFFDSTAKVVTAVTPAAAIVASTIWPGSGTIISLVAAVLVGLVGMWAKMKPQVTQAKTAGEQTLAILTSSVTAVENFKKNNPAEWEKLSAEYEKLIPRGSVADNVIRKLRGLLPIAQ